MISCSVRWTSLRTGVFSGLETCNHTSCRNLDHNCFYFFFAMPFLVAGSATLFENIIGRVVCVETLNSIFRFCRSGNHESQTVEFDLEP